MKKKNLNVMNENYLPGSMNPSGTEIKKTKEKANVKADNISNRKQNHSIAAAMWNLGREYLSVNFMFVSRNLDS